MQVFFYSIIIPYHNTKLWFYRYAEIQRGPNGLRYRDWVCVYADDHSVEKCKLDSHIITVTDIHKALFPWKRKDSTEWVNVCSSIQSDLRILYDTSKDRTKDRFSAFAQTIRGRLNQDLLILPTRDASHDLNRQNMTMYTDKTNKQIMVVYSPTVPLDHETRLEFISFNLI